MLLQSLTVPELAYAALCIFIAAVARGFCGFGFSLLTVMSLSFVLAPAQIVPALFVLEIAAGVRLLPSLMGQVHWRSIRLLVGASVIATPLGAVLLAVLSESAIRLMLALIVLATALALLSGWRMQRMPNTVQTTATGLGAGVLNGALGLGGPPVIVFFLGSPLALEAGRASIIAAFLAMDVVALPSLWAMGLFGWDTLVCGLLALPPLLLGVWCGARLVGRFSERGARRLIVAVLLVMALGGLGQAMA